MKTMTDDSKKRNALSVYVKMENIMVNLYSRWLEGKDDINDYAVKIKPEVEKAGGIFIKMIKIPFGFQYTLGDAVYVVCIASGEYKYKRIS